MSEREKLLERQVQALQERCEGIAAVARLAFEGEGNGMDNNMLSSVLLMIEREAETISTMLDDLPQPTQEAEPVPPPQKKPRAVVQPIRKTPPDEIEPSHAQ